MPEYSGFMWHADALDHLSTIPHKQRAQIIKKAKALMLDPYPPGCKKLQGITSTSGEAVYRERSGDYRILYMVKTIPHTIVVVLDVGHRKEVYR